MKALEVHRLFAVYSICYRQDYIADILAVYLKETSS